MCVHSVVSVIWSVEMILVFAVTMGIDAKSVVGVLSVIFDVSYRLLVKPITGVLLVVDEIEICTWHQPL